MAIRVSVAGVTGEVGHLLAAGILAQESLLLTSAVARYLESWEIIEYAHDDKIDAISGTARELAHRLKELLFGRTHERLTIRHEAASHSEPYIEGTLLAIRKVPQLLGVHRGLESVLNLNLG